MPLHLHFLLSLPVIQVKSSARVLVANIQVSLIWISLPSIRILASIWILSTIWIRASAAILLMLRLKMILALATKVLVLGLTLSWLVTTASWLLLDALLRLPRQLRSFSLLSDGGCTFELLLTLLSPVRCVLGSLS